MHRLLIFPKFRYPKFMLLLLSYVLAYLLFANQEYPAIRENLSMLGYLGIFAAGVLYSYGFTSGPAASIFYIMSHEVNIVAAGLLAGVGSLLGDLIIFQFIKIGFEEEINKLGHEELFRRIRLPSKLSKLIVPVIASIFIASPLPDEIGVSILATTRISTKVFSAISYILNTTGIFFILLLGS